VTFVHTEWKDKKGTWHKTTKADLRAAAKQLLAIYPVPAVEWTASDNEFIFTKFSDFPSDDDAWEHLAQRVVRLRKLEDCREGCSRIYMGVIVDSPDVNVTGWSDNIPGNGAIAYLDQSGSIAHEMGHLLGLRHPKQCLDGAAFEGYPYAKGMMSPTSTGDKAFYGFDYRVPRVVTATTTFDLMCYEKGRWPSDWTYAKMDDALVARFGP
jgi:hypothetical protein